MSCMRHRGINICLHTERKKTRGGELTHGRKVCGPGLDRGYGGRIQR